MRKVWINGDIVDEHFAKLSIYDSALMFGDMVFEMTRTFNGVQFKLREHLERLYRSIKYVQIPIEMTIEEMEQACLEVQEANEFEPDDEHRLMINVTRGTLPIYSETNNSGPNVIISDFPLRWAVAGMGPLFDNGINAVIPSQRAIPAFLLDPKVKSRSRLHYQMANIEVSRYEGKNNWPLLLDLDGYVTESTGANFFIVINGELLTSHPNNVLRGVSRAYINQAYTITEWNFGQWDVLTADEAFFTATPFCMLPVTSLNGAPIGNGKVGPVYQQLLKNWSTNVGVDIKAQIQAWDKYGRPEGPSPYQFK
jgi:branched-chain amino acid aminotransferase